MTTRPPRLAPLGDAAITVTYADRIDDVVHARLGADARRVAAALGSAVEVVPAYSALTIHYDPAHWSFAELRDRLLPILAGPGGTAAPAPGPLIEVPVRYDGEDLDAVARATGLTSVEVITRHTGPEYRVYLLGFVPGFAYLGPLDPALVLPRRATPRPRVPSGSVAIAGSQTGIYPAATPGGWHLLGRTAVPLFDPARDPPALLAVGDRVRFVAER